MPPTYFVPPETATILEQNLERCHNLSLLMSRFIPEEVIRNADVEGVRNQKWRDKWLREQCQRFRIEGESGADWRVLRENTFERWWQQTSHATRFRGIAYSRLVMGLGAKGPLETGLTLQYVTGLPIIPGSTLKGLCRSYGLFTLALSLGVPVLNFEQLKRFREDNLKRNSEGKPKRQLPLTQLDNLLAAPDRTAKQVKERQRLFTDLSTTLDELKTQYGDKIKGDKNKLVDHNTLPEAKLFRRIFGSTAESGWCVFYDSVVAGLPRPEVDGTQTLFELDVMTPHFRQYYESLSRNTGLQAPNDADAPNPIGFLTVAANTQFAFAISERLSMSAMRRHEQTEEMTVSVQQAVVWLKDGLSEMGIGAKTAAGYGVFGDWSDQQ